jgi:hypothetical protein
MAPQSSKISGPGKASRLITQEKPRIFRAPLAVQFYTAVLNLTVNAPGTPDAHPEAWD